MGAGTFTFDPVNCTNPWGRRQTSYELRSSCWTTVQCQNFNTALNRFLMRRGRGVGIPICRDASGYHQRENV